MKTQLFKTTSDACDRLGNSELCDAPALDDETVEMCGDFELSELDEYVGVPFANGKMLLVGKDADFDRARCVALLRNIEMNARNLRDYFENLAVFDTSCVGSPAAPKSKTER